MLDPMKHKDKFKPNSKIYKKLSFMIDEKTFTNTKEFKDAERFFSVLSEQIKNIHKISTHGSDGLDDEKFGTRYPLLLSVNRWSYDNNEDLKEKFIEHAIAYINDVDTEKI